MTLDSGQPTLRVHVEGKRLSLRQVQYLCSMTETALLWACLDILTEDAAYGNAINTDIGKDYMKFLRRRHAPVRQLEGEVRSILRAAIAPLYFANRKQEEDPREFDHVLYEIERALPRRDLEDRSLDEFLEFEDFTEFVVERYGDRVLPVSEVSSERSVDLVFSLAALMSVVFAPENRAAVDEVLGRAKRVIESWIGKTESKSKTHVLSFPSLPRSLERTIAQYDEVEVRTTQKGEFEMHLKRTSTVREDTSQ
jgi:hypothetical protein